MHEQILGAIKEFDTIIIHRKYANDGSLYPTV